MLSFSLFVRRQLWKRGGRAKAKGTRERGRGGLRVGRKSAEGKEKADDILFQKRNG